MSADAYLPHWLHRVPCQHVFHPGGRLRENVYHAVKQKVVRVIAGPLECHVMIDVQRPYFRAVMAPAIDEAQP